MRKMITVMIKIVLFPAALVLRIVTGIMLAVMKLSSVIAGPFFVLLMVLAVFCLIRQEWTNLILLAGIAAGVWTLYFITGYACGIAESLCDRILI